MRVIVYVAFVGVVGCSSSTSTLAPSDRDAALVTDASPVADAGPVKLPTRQPAPRVPMQIDGYGVGVYVLGLPAAKLTGVIRQRGRAGFSQGGVGKIKSIRTGGKVTIKTAGGDDELEVRVNPVQNRVSEISVVGPGPVTAEGIRVGSTRAQVTAAYGVPIGGWESFRLGDCDVFAKRPGVGFCYRDNKVVQIEVPALRRRPPTLPGTELDKLRAQVEGRYLGERMLRAQDLVAPCLLFLRFPDSSGGSWDALRIADGNVYAEGGGWRTSGGGFAFCDGGSLYTMDARGEAVRWTHSLRTKAWHPEPSMCESDMRKWVPTITCRGITAVRRSTVFVFGNSLRPSTDPPRRLLRAVDDPPAGVWAECEALANRVWREVMPALDYLGQNDPGASLRIRNAWTVRDLVGACAVSTSKQRACLRDVPALLVGPWCSKKRYLVDTSRFYTLLGDYSPALTGAQKKAIRSGLRGPWRQPAFLSHGMTVPARSIVLSRTGKSAEVTGPGLPAGRFEVGLKRRGALVLRSAKTTRHYTFAQKDKDHFYLSLGQVVAWLPPDHRNFDVRMPITTRGPEGTIVARNGSCKFLRSTGQLADATCSFTSTSLTVVTTDRDNQAITARYDIVDGFLVEQGARPFVRKR